MTDEDYAQVVAGPLFDDPDFRRRVEAIREELTEQARAAKRPVVWDDLHRAATARALEEWHRQDRGG